MAQPCWALHLLIRSNGLNLERAPRTMVGKLRVRNRCLRGVWAGVYVWVLRDGLHGLPMGKELLSLHNRTTSSINICSGLGAQLYICNLLLIHGCLPKSSVQICQPASVLCKYFPFLALWPNISKKH